MPVWLQSSDVGVTLTLKIVPRASRNEVGGTVGDALKIRLQAPPVEGKANAALIAFLADILEVPARSVSLLSGETGRLKRVRVAGVTPGQAEARLSGKVE